MISQKVKDLADEANNFLKTNTIYTSDQFCYGFADKLVQMVIDDVLNLIENTNLKDITFTTYDKDRMDYCRSKIMENVINGYRKSI